MKSKKVQTEMVWFCLLLEHKSNIHVYDDALYYQLLAICKGVIAQMNFPLLLTEHRWEYKFGDVRNTDFAAKIRIY